PEPAPQMLRRRRRALSQGRRRLETSSSVVPLLGSCFSTGPVSAKLPIAYAPSVRFTRLLPIVPRSGDPPEPPCMTRTLDPLYSGGSGLMWSSVLSSEQPCSNDSGGTRHAADSCNPPEESGLPMTRQRCFR